MDEVNLQRDEYTVIDEGYVDETDVGFLGKANDGRYRFKYLGIEYRSMTPHLIVFNPNHAAMRDKTSLHLMYEEIKKYDRNLWEMQNTRDIVSWYNTTRATNETIDFTCCDCAFLSATTNLRDYDSPTKPIVIYGDEDESLVGIFIGNYTVVYGESEQIDFAELENARLDKIKAIEILKLIGDGTFDVFTDFQAKSYTFQLNDLDGSVKKIESKLAFKEHLLKGMKELDEMEKDYNWYVRDKPELDPAFLEVETAIKVGNCIYHTEHPTFSRTL